MALSVTHSTVVVVADDGTSPVGTDEWNAAHTLTGTVAEAQGGTNQTTYALGDTLYSSATNTLAKLAGNTTATKKYLTQTGTGAVSAAPAWGTIAAADVPVFVASGASHAPGAVPDPGVTGGTTKFL